MPKKNKKSRKKSKTTSRQSIGFSRKESMTKPDALSRFDPRSNEQIYRQIQQIIEEYGIDAMKDGGELSDPNTLNKLLEERPILITSDLEQAQDLMYRAFEAESKKDRIWFAKKAKSISADCVDAYIVLAEEDTDSSEQAIELYRQGIEAGRRVLGEEAFRENVGYFWKDVQTRPFMRALYGLGRSQYFAGALQDAIRSFNELLFLNPDDNQGARYLLLHWLIQARDFKAAKKLLSEFPDGVHSSWKYAEALLSFAEFGDTNKSSELLRKAIQSNAFVPEYLLMIKDLPIDLPRMYSIGDESEAVDYMMSSSISWCETPGAKEWLRDEYLSEEEIDILSKRADALDIIEILPIDELVLLNHRICDRIKEIEDRKMRETIAKLSVGDLVSFFDNNGEQVRGVIKKLHKKSAAVLSESLKEWKVSVNLLRKVDSLKSSPEDSKRVLTDESTRH